MGWRVDTDWIGDEQRLEEKYLLIFHRTPKKNSFRYSHLYIFCLYNDWCLDQYCRQIKVLLWFEPLRDKTNILCAPSEDSDQPGNPQRLNWRVFAVCMKTTGSVATYWVHSLIIIRIIIKLGGSLVLSCGGPFIVPCGSGTEFYRV